METRLDNKREEEKFIERVLRQSERQELNQLVSDTVRQAFNSFFLARLQLPSQSSLGTIRERSTERKPPRQVNGGTGPMVSSPSSHQAVGLSLGGEARLDVESSPLNRLRYKGGF